MKIRPIRAVSCTRALRSARRSGDIGVVLLASIVGSCILSGCTVLAVADTVGTVAVSAVGVAADAAIGTVKIAGKVVGKAADAVTGSSATPSK